MVTGGVCSMYFQHYIRVISLVQKGRDYLEEDQRHSDRGSSPEWKDTFAIDDKGGDIYQMQRTEAWFQMDQIY